MHTINFKSLRLVAKVFLFYLCFIKHYGLFNSETEPMGNQKLLFTSLLLFFVFL